MDLAELIGQVLCVFTIIGICLGVLFLLLKLTKFDVRSLIWRLEGSDAFDSNGSNDFIQLVRVKFVSSLKKLLTNNAEQEINTAASQFMANFYSPKVYEVSVPKDTKWDPDSALRFMEHILIIFGMRVLFRILVENRKIHWQIIDCNQTNETPVDVVKAIHSIYPDSEVTIKTTSPVKFSAPFVRDTVSIKLPRRYFAPIKSILDDKKTDPLLPIINSLSEVNRNERLIYSIYVDEMVLDDVNKIVRKEIERNQAKDLIIGMFYAIFMGLLDPKSSSTYNPVGTGKTKRGIYHEDLQKIYEEKLYDHELVDVCIILQKDYFGIQHNPNRKKVGILDELALFLSQYKTKHNGLAPFGDGVFREEFTNRLVDSEEVEVQTNSLALIRDYFIQSGYLEYKPRRIKKDKGRVVLTFAELAGLWHLPHEQMVNTRGIQWVKGKRAPAILLERFDGVIIGENQIAGQKHQVRIHTADRQTHMNIIGKTGVGKSTFMHNLIHQDIAAGNGIAVIDPHGELVRNILRVSIPDSRIDDVCVLDIANTSYPPPLNPLSAANTGNSYMTDSIVSILDKTEDGGLPDQTADTLTAVLATLRYTETPTVRDIFKLLEDGHYQSQLLSKILHQIQDPTIIEFWDKFSKLSEPMHETLIRPVLHRVRKFYRNPLLHFMLCHPDRLNFPEFVKQKKIILISMGIDQRLVPHREKQLVGMIVTSLIQSAGMATINRRFPFYLYVDEVQELITSPLDEVLVGARKYFFHLIIANQFLGQLRGKTLDAVMGNVGATLVFQASEKDASTLAPYFKHEFQTEDLLNQDLYNAVVKTRFQGKALPAFSITTKGVPGDVGSDEAKQREALIRNHSIRLYTPKSRDEVQAWLNNRYPPPSFPSTSDGPNNWIDPN